METEPFSFMPAAQRKTENVKLLSLSSPYLIFIPVRRGAGAFGGDHAGAQGLGRGAGFSEQGAGRRAQDAPEDFAAAAGRRRRRGEALPDLGEPGPGVEPGVGLANPDAAAGDDAQAPPGGVLGGKDLGQQLPGPGVGGNLNRPGIDVVHQRLALLELAQDRFYPQEHVHGLKSRDRAGEAEFGGDEVVGLGPDDGGDVAGAEEPGNPHLA